MVQALGAKLLDNEDQQIGRAAALETLAGSIFVNWTNVLRSAVLRSPAM
jgi:glycerate kinase